jgi:hypothetical protein
MIIVDLLRVNQLLDNGMFGRRAPEAPIAVRDAPYNMYE